MEKQFYQMYLDELSEIPECTNEEMEALLNSLPNEEAVKRLTEGSLAYVVREAAKYAGNDVEISDLVQEGNMALLLVLKNYKLKAFSLLIDYLSLILNPIPRTVLMSLLSKFLSILFLNL